MKKVVRKILSIVVATSVVMACFTTTAFAAQESTASAVGVSYSAHVQDIGWQSAVADGVTAGTTGQSKRVEALTINLTNAPAGASIAYQVHVQDYGWISPASKDGALAGTTGQSKRVEAIAITLDGMPGYSVEYRVHVQDIGWMAWTQDGNIAGTTGRSLRMEAIEIKIVSVPVSAVSVSPTTMTLTAGGATGTITAIIDPSDATNKNVTWSSSDVNTATVAGGVVTPIAEGTATITVTTADGVKTAACAVTVTSGGSPIDVIPVSDITVTGTGSATTIITDNGTLQMLAAVLPTNATNSNVIWSVTNGTGSATISATGLLTAVTNGTVTVKATSVSTGSVNGTAVITISNQLGAAVTGLTGVLQLGETITATAATTEAGAGLWTSSTPAVARVNESDGLVDALTAGTTTIFYRYSTSGNLNSQVITVYAAATVDDPAIGLVQVGAAAVTPTGFTAAGDGQTIAWASSAPGKATVDATTGVITAVAAGHTTISYSVVDTTGVVVVKGSLAITVAAAADLAAYNAALALVDEEDYTTASWTTYEGVLADNVATTANTQAQVTTATGNITTAQGDLVFAGQADLDAAIVAEGLLTPANYVDYSAVTAALALSETTNALVVTKTTAINNAITALVFAGKANLDTAKAAELLLTAADYVDYSAVTTALALSETTNDLVVAKTTAINNAISALVKVVDANLAAAKAAEALLTSTDYVDYSAVTAALALSETTNALVVTKTTAINNAITALVFAGKANLDTAKAAELLLTAADYVDYSAVTAALALSETTNDLVVAKTTAINNAIAALVLKSDLTDYNAALALVDEADYTTASWTTYQGVVTTNAVTVANTQDAVDAATLAITTAQSSLITKADAAADNFKTTHATVLALTVDNVAIVNKAAVNEALAAYDLLSAAAKAKLTTEKSLLDNLLVKIGVLEITPANSTSGITNQVFGIDGSKQAILTITVKNSAGGNLTGLLATDFTVKISGASAVNFTNGSFSGFTDNTNGTYTVIFTGVGNWSYYGFTDLTAKGVVIETGPTGVTTPPAVAPILENITVSADGTTITLDFDKAMHIPTNPAILAEAISVFSAVVDGQSREFSGLALNTDTTKIELTLSGSPIVQGVTVTLSYDGGYVQSTDLGFMESLSDQSVTNNSTVPVPVLSSDATLSTSSTIKGVGLSDLGTPATTQVGALRGIVTITSAQAADTTNLTAFITRFVPTDAGARLTRVVKYASTEPVTDFATDPIYENEAIAYYDFFAIQITAANDSVLHYCIKVLISG